MHLRNSLIDGLKIFTLNCWGLRYISYHRKLRIKLIAQHLVDQDYDIVFLQEVWIQSDFEYIRTKTKLKFRFAHMFNNASLLGTSGLVILTKWIPKLIHFHPYSINGSPFRPLHGDWFSTKGVAYVRIELDEIGLNLHLFSTHMHAQYDINEKVIDQYSVHRICQAYELGKFINLMSCNCSKTASKDLIILAGDMNTSSKELPYKLLNELTDLNDCYKLLKTQKQINRKKGNDVTLLNNIKRINKQKFQELVQESSDEELATCGHRDNTFTAQQTIKTNQKIGKRIDFIFYKLRDSFPCLNAENRSNKVNEVTTLLKNNESTSDDNKADNKVFLRCIPEKLTVLAKDVSGLSFSDHQPVVARLIFSWKTFQEIVNEENSNSNDENSSMTNEIKQCSISKMGIKMNTKPLNDDENFLSQPLYKKWKDSSLVQEIEDLLSAYIDKFKPSIKYSVFIVLFIFFIFLISMIIFKFTINMTLTEIFLMTIIFLIITIIGLLLKFITLRTEINAIKAILNDIHKKKTFHPDYGLSNVDMSIDD